MIIRKTASTAASTKTIQDNSSNFITPMDNQLSLFKVQGSQLKNILTGKTVKSGFLCDKAENCAVAVIDQMKVILDRKKIPFRIAQAKTSFNDKGEVSGVTVVIEPEPENDRKNSQDAKDEIRNWIYEHVSNKAGQNPHLHVYHSEKLVS